MSKNMDLQNKILEHLSENPDKSKSQIAKSLGYKHPGNVNKQINALAEEQYVRVSSDYKKRGSTRERWSLSPKGIGLIFEESDYDVTRLLDIVELYRAHKFVAIFARVMNMLSDMSVDCGLVVGSYLGSFSNVFSGLMGTGTSFQLLVELTVRDLWEAPTYESPVDYSLLGDIWLFRGEGEEYTEDQYREDVFDWVLRCHVDKIGDFDVFAMSCEGLFPLVFGDWEKIKEYGLDEWVVYVLNNAIKSIQYRTIIQVSELGLRYTHQDFIEDLYSFIFGPNLYESGGFFEDDLMGLCSYITYNLDVRVGIENRIRKLEQLDETRKQAIESYRERFLEKSPQYI